MNIADTDSSEYSEDDDEDYESDRDQARLIVSEIERALRGKREFLKNVRDQADRNADALVAEEEKTKRRAEKRRAYKKKRKEKKKQEKGMAVASKVDSKSSSPKSGANRNKKSEDSEANSEEELDPRSAFVANVAGKISEPATTVNKEKIHGKEKLQKDEEFLGSTVEARVLQSRQLAIKGNELASLGNFEEAVIKFSRAIELDPTDYRFFGNRSYCFDRQGYYDRALKDSEKAIRMAPSWPKGFFRKGRALFGLKKYSDAEEAFQQVLKLDKNCQEAIDEIFSIRTEQIIELGFTRDQAELALKKHASVQTAVDALLSGTVDEICIEDEIYVSDDDFDDTRTIQSPVDSRANSRVATNTTGRAQNTAQNKVTSSTAAATNDFKMNPNNPEGRKSLWVGNVQQSVSDRQLHQLFAKHGHVVSVKRFPDKYCAFINYADKESAGRAMKLVQGVELANYKLLIKYPDNPKDEEGTIILKKTKTLL